MRHASVYTLENNNNTGDTLHAHSAAQAAPLEGSLMRILLAEDDAVLANGLSRSLRRTGFAVATAALATR